MSTPVAETKPAEEQVPKEEAIQETSTTSKEVQMKEEKEAAAEPSTKADASTTVEPPTTAEPPTAMEVDSSLNETKPEAVSGEETKPAAEADGTKSDDAKAKNDDKLRLNRAARKRCRWLLVQGYTREEAAQLAKEPLKTKELRDRFNADTMKLEVKVDEKDKKLSGAARKRFKWFVKKGYNKEEAFNLALEVKHDAAAKRSQAVNGGPSGKVSKPSPDAAGGIVMAVAARDYPTTSLTNEQSKEVKSAILKEVVQQKDSELKPRFESCVLRKGYLRFHCSDQETCQWLQRVVAKLTVPEGISLKVVAERNLLKGDIYTGNFTNSRNETNEAILEFVKSQNDGIDTSKWKILTRKEVQKTQSIELVFTVDEASAKSIHNLGYELNYKFNKIKIGKQSKSGDAPAAGNKNVRNARSMAPPQSARRRPFNQPRPTSNFSVPVWDSNFPQKRADNNFNQFANPRNSFSSGSGNSRSQGGNSFGNSRSQGGNSFGNSRSHGGNSFGLGGGGSGSFGMDNGGGNNSYGDFNSFGGNNSNGRSNSNSRSNSFGGDNSNGRSNSFGGSNNNFGTGSRGGNQSNSNRPSNLVDSLYDQLKLIGSGSGGNSNQNNNSVGSSRRTGGGNISGSRKWGENTFYNLGNSSSY